MEFNLFLRQAEKSISNKAYSYALGNLYLDFSENRIRSIWEFEMDKIFYLVTLDEYSLLNNQANFTIQFSI
jgi:hypothetical protein